MAALETVMTALHLLFGGLWAGAVLFVTVSILPLAHRGAVNAEPTSAVADRLMQLSRLSALVLFLTGGYLAGERYTGAQLLGTTRGHLVVEMILLWLALAALTEVGAKRLTDSLDDAKDRTAARESQRLFQAASVVAVAVLLVGGVLA
jgi:putative copper export protein